MDIEAEVKKRAPDLALQIQQAAASSHNEAEFRTKITQLIDNLAGELKLPIYLSITAWCWNIKHQEF